MRVTIEYLELTLENCEVLRIPGHCIGDFFAGKIESVVQRVACNAIMPMEICHQFYIEIHKDADVLVEDGYGDQAITLFDRLMMYRDITGVDIHFIDPDYSDHEKDVREAKSFYLDWRGNGIENPHQTFRLSRLGHLYIVVDASTTVEEVYPDSYINDEEGVAIRFELCDVGDANKEAAEQWHSAARARFAELEGSSQSVDSDQTGIQGTEPVL